MTTTASRPGTATLLGDLARTAASTGTGLTGSPVESKWIRAAAPGVARPLNDSGMGLGVEVVHSPRAKTRSWHMSIIDVADGQIVDTSTILGSMGDTGTEAPDGSPHLHFELYIDGVRVDPWPYFRRTCLGPRRR